MILVRAKNLPDPIEYIKEATEDPTHTLILKCYMFALTDAVQAFTSP